MINTLPAYQLDTPVIPAHHQPAILLDLAASRDINMDQLLRGTRLFEQQLTSQRVLITPDQFYQLIDNSIRLINAPDTAFLFGQRLLPGHYGAASECLRHTHTLYEALEFITTLQTILSPLLTPRLIQDDQFVYLYWQESCRQNSHSIFLVEAAMTSVYSLSRMLTGQKLPWRFQFSHCKPRHIEQYWLHLGHQLSFDQKLDMMRLPREYLNQPLAGSATLTAQFAADEAQIQLQQLGYQQGMLAQVREQIERMLQNDNIRLECVASSLGMSTSSFKRLLGKHNTSFQQQLDQVRKLTALELMLIRHLSNEDVAQILHIHDAANFRRCLKRWTGLAPNQLRSLWVK